MSEPVELDVLQDTIEALPQDAFLMTVGASGAAHVVSASPKFDNGRIRVGAGNTTRANAATTPAVTLLWPRADDRYCLIVDGLALESGGDLLVEPTKAILHRLASADPGLPNCVAVATARGDRA